MKILISLTLIFLFSNQASAELFALVHKKNTSEFISKSDFIDFYTGEKTSWDGENAVVFAMLDIKTKSGKTFFKDYMPMSEKKFIDHWVNIELFGKGIAPLNFKDTAKIYTFIKKYKKNGLAFIDKSEANNLPKTLKLIPIK